jgi:hypothetical protein
MVCAIARSLDKLLVRATTVLAARARGQPTVRARGRDWFGEIVAIARRLHTLVRELVALIEQLDGATGRYSRDTRAD